jgi:hypothetical protein
VPDTDDDLEPLRGAIIGVFVLFSVGGGAALSAVGCGAAAAGAGGPAWSVLLLAIAGGVFGVWVSLAFLVDLMALPRWVALRRLVSVLVFGVLAAAGTLLSPIQGSWGALSAALGAGACAAAVAGAALLTERKQPS